MTQRSSLRSLLRPFRSQLACAALAALALPAASAQRGAETGTTAPGGNVSREAMWPAPTEEDWAKPCLITFQRTWADAEAVAAATGKPLMVCVNMDGEIASEHYAGIRYRDPEIAALYEPYVCVIASVYRHTPRDYDEQGRRLLCPRFGSVTCGEHIEIEPIVYEKFLDGRRIAPRHIMVELDGSEVYDVYYAFDTASVFKTIRVSIEDRPPPPEQPSRGDLPLVDRLASPDIADRVYVERAFRNGDRVLQAELLRAALARGQDLPLEILRLALHGPDEELARMAREALARSGDERSIGLILEALRTPMEEYERDALVAALGRLGQTSTRARTLASVYRGLSSNSASVDAEKWAAELERSDVPVAARDRYAIESRVERQARATRERPEDAEAQLEFAEAALALAVDPETALTLGSNERTQSRYARLMFLDVRRAALRARELGATGWRVDAALALAAFYLGEVPEAHRLAERAAQELPSGEQSWNAMAVLAIFAQARQQAIGEAVQAQREWPDSWLADLHSAYSVLAKHPLGTDAQVVAHHDFLRWLGADGRAADVLDEGLARFPESWLLHDRLRGRILRERGLEGLEQAYEELLAADGASPNLSWFAGYTSIVAAEFHRRRGDAEEADAAYGRALSHYDASVAGNPTSRPSADHYAALALAGRARLALEARDWDAAVEHMVASFERSPEAAASLDGLNLTPMMTSTTLLARLQEGGHDALAQRLEAARSALPPAAFVPPEFETSGRPGPGSGAPPARRGGGRRPRAEGADRGGAAQSEGGDEGDPGPPPR